MYAAKACSRPCALLRFRSMISSILSLRSCLQDSEISSDESTESKSSMELALRYVLAYFLDRKMRANLQWEPSLRFSVSSSSDAWRLAFLECLGEFATDEPREEILDCAFLETVLPLSRACLRRSLSCIFTAACLTRWRGSWEE